MRRFEDALAGKDPAAFTAVVAPDLHFEDPLSTPLTGPDELVAHVSRMWAAFPDARIERTGPLMTSGAHVADPVKLVATHRGELEGLPASGRFVVVHAVLVCELADDVIWRMRAFYDAYDAAVQLGVMPDRGSMGEKALLMLRGFGLRARN